MNVFQQISIVGFVVLGLIALILVCRRIVKEGISFRAVSPTTARTAFDVFAECIPLRKPRMWAAGYFAAFIAFLIMLVVSSGR
jgi:hypothetical protein